MIEWRQHHAVLLRGARAALGAFFEKTGREDVCAVGFVFELWNASPSFHLCADRWVYRRSCPDWDSAEARWNSGGFEFPAALLSLGELGREWDATAAELHRLAADKRCSRDVYDGLVRVSCEVLADLAREGLFGDWRGIDFNVSEVNDGIEVVRARDALIRQLIAPAAEPSLGLSK
jgi:hypothetical protein